MQCDGGKQSRGPPAEHAEQTDSVDLAIHPVRGPRGLARQEILITKGVM